MPDTTTNDSLKLANVQIDDLLTMGDDAPVDLAEQAAAPGAPPAGRVRLYARSDGRCYSQDDAGNEVALDPETGGAVLKSLFDAHTILKADSDDLPAALAIGEGRLVGRQAGGSIAALDAAGVLEILAAALAPRLRASRWYDGFGLGDSGRVVGAGFELDQDRLYALPFFCPWTTSWEAIGVGVETPEAGKQIKLGVYAMEPDGEPGARLYQSAALSVSTSGAVAESGIALTLASGWYFVAARTDATALKLHKVYRTYGRRFLGSTGLTDDAATLLHSDSGSYAADGMPDPFPAGPASNTAHQTLRVALKTSATP